ncbi:transglutaminase-like domain-containing protein [Helicovermis profundi]|uniref:Transglutaminase-like domain-containing protein n=1 Tax=Helicovermis profundi TaxID=3065157 RepID=A0AAU9EMU6_9FIRM|nr:hypothetical protein HLPR_01060 [Clostridia bacterium S502]
MKKKVIFLTMMLIVLFCVGISFSEDNLANAEIKIVNFSVNINGESIDNIHSDFPLISYKDITYFPMTWDFSQALGLKTNWSNETGLVIESNGEKGKLKQALNSNNSKFVSKIANFPKFKIKIKGVNVDNSKEEYPILVYRDITYFPLTWKYAVETFGWDYNWNKEKGLSIAAKMTSKNENDIKPVINTDDSDTKSDITTDISATNEDKTNINIKETYSPISKFTDADIKLLGIDIDKSQTPKKIADAIYEWEHNNMIFADSKKTYVDAADAMRFNYYFGDIYTTRDMIKNMKDGTKWYGICYNYATLFKSIGEYYGLEVKIENTILKPSETLDFGNKNNTLIPPGMSTEEYSRLKVLLEKKNLDYPYEAVRLIATETPAHYRSLVKIDGQWKIYDDVSDITNSASVLAKYEFEDTSWTKGMQTDKLNGYITRLNNGESLKGEGYSSTFEEFQTARNLILETGEGEGYVGITDDLGQKGRAANIDDFMQGKGLIPYFNTYAEVQKFLSLGSETNENTEEMMAMKKAYEENTGKKFYMVADEMIYGDDDNMPDEKYAVMYESYVGERLNFGVFKKINAE